MNENSARTRRSRRSGRTIRAAIGTCLAVAALSSVAAAPASASIFHNVVDPSAYCGRGQISLSSNAHSSTDFTGYYGPETWIAIRYHVYVWSGGAWQKATTTNFNLHQARDYGTAPSESLSVRSGSFVGLTSETYHWNPETSRWTGPFYPSVRHFDPVRSGSYYCQVS